MNTRGSIKVGGRPLVCTPAGGRSLSRIGKETSRRTSKLMPRRLLHREVAHPERARRRCSHESPVIVETGYGVLLSSKGEVAPDGHFRPSWRSYKDGVLMCRYVDRHANVIRRTCRVMQGRSC